ncbi:MAG: hypothetical protein IPM37_09455 [Hahellaceae bacterium]|nr:hypothetical protein [Hahellaceae bacterium]
MVWTVLIKRAPVAGLCLVLTSVALAEPARLTLSTGLEYSDNVGKDAKNSKDDVTSINEFGLSNKVSKGPLDVDFNLSAMYQNYLNDSFKDWVMTESYLDATYKFNKQFSWLLEDRLSDVPEDSSKADTPDNIVRLNVFKTGPKYTRYWNQRNFTELSAYFIDVSYEGRQIDSQRLRGVATQNWLYADLYRSGVQGEVESARIDDAKQTNTESGSLAFLLGKTFRYGQWGAKLGAATLTRNNDDKLDATDEGWIGQFDFLYKVTGKTDFSAEVGREFTDSASDKVLSGFDELKVLRAIDVIEQDRFRLALDYELSKRDRYQVSFTSFSDKYQDQNFTEKSRNTRFRWMHWHTPRIQSAINVTRQMNEFSNSNVTKKLWQSGYSLSYMPTKHVQVAGYVRYEEAEFNTSLSDYNEFATGFTLTWMSRK